MPTSTVSGCPETKILQEINLYKDASQNAVPDIGLPAVLIHQAKWILEGILNRRNGRI